MYPNTSRVQSVLEQWLSVMVFSSAVMQSPRTVLMMVSITENISKAMPYLDVHQMPSKVIVVI